MTEQQVRESGRNALVGKRMISRAVHIHPTVAELIPTVLQEMRPLE